MARFPSVDDEMNLPQPTRLILSESPELTETFVSKSASGTDFLSPTQIAEEYETQTNVDAKISNAGIDRAFWWDGTTYQPEDGLGIVGDGVRQFYGPVDPRTVEGVVNGLRDVWKKTIVPALPTTGLVHHYRCDSLLGTLDAGDVVTTWPDLIGTAHLVSVGSPILEVDGQGLPDILLDSVDDAFGVAMTLAQPSTVFAVGQWTDANRANLVLIGSNSTSTNRNNIATTAGGVVQGFSGTNLVSGVVAPLAWAHHAMTFNGADSRIQVGDTVVTGAGGAEGRSGLQVGRGASTSSNFAGLKVREIAIYNRAMTDDEHTYIRNLFKKYWSIA